MSLRSHSARCAVYTGHLTLRCHPLQPAGPVSMCTHVLGTTLKSSCVHVQLQAHMQQASAAGKPMVVDEFNRKKPVSFRNSFLTEAYSMMNAAGSPVVGECVTRSSTAAEATQGLPMLSSSHTCSTVVCKASACSEDTCCPAGKNIWMPASSSDPDYGKPSCADGCHVSMHLLNAPAVPMHELDSQWPACAAPQAPQASLQASRPG